MGETPEHLWGGKLGTTEMFSTKQEWATMCNVKQEHGIPFSL